MSKEKRTANDALKDQMRTMLTVHPKRVEEPIVVEALRASAKAAARNNQQPNRVVTEGGVAYLYRNQELVGWIPESQWEAMKKGLLGAPNQ